MLTEFLLDQAALYTAGAMTAQEREKLELILEFHQELRSFVSQLEDVAVAIATENAPSQTAAPSPRLKARVMGLVGSRQQQSPFEGFVMTSPDGLVQWVNPAFSKMCGYTLYELRGKKLGPILQGAGTDRATAERMRRAIHEYRPCREKILNYHKNGTAYWVDVSITPILDDAEQPLWLVARERELTEPVAA